MSSPSVALEPKRHYPILDGLRGVASAIVIIFHTFEVYDGGDAKKQILNHGYLAVDFFFMLSGFVIAYAYDDRWHAAGGRQRMTLWGFFKRRIIRLPPVLVMGNVLGALLFYLSASPKIFPLVAATPVWRLAVVALIGCTVIPIPVSM